MKSINEEITRIGTEVEKRCAKYRVEVEATKEDCERLPFTGLKVGDKFTKDDLKSLDSYEKFKQYFLDTNCYFEFQYLVIRFQREYKIIELITAEAVKEEIGNIEKFLKDAQEIPIKDALILGDATQSELFEYRRLSYEDYYRGRYLESKVEIKYPAIIYHQHAARVYAKCFYFKDWLEDLLKHITINEDNKSILPPQPIDKEQNRTKKVIAETFENMDKKGWQYAFATEQDCNLFTDLLTNFFEYKDYSIPNTVIQLKRTCKTKVAKALGEIHAELSENPLNSDTEYFKIVKVLNHFKDVSNFDLVKAMQR